MSLKQISTKTISIIALRLFCFPFSTSSACGIKNFVQVGNQQTKNVPQQKSGITLQVADPVIVAVLEGTRINLVDDHVFPPIWVRFHFHVTTSSWQPRNQRNQAHESEKLHVPHLDQQFAFKNDKCLHIQSVSFQNIDKRTKPKRLRCKI